jgi:hypothetical protein
MTGSYGYSFAVPSNIARKIIEDLMEYGNVQRAILGVEGGELNAASKALGIQTEGFYVGAVTKIQVLKSLDLKRRYYRKMDGQRLLLMRTCLDISIPKDQMIKYR